MKKSFMTGAMILMAANAISKILGAVFKIPLTYIIHEEGMAVYNTSFSVYVMFLSFFVSGMPFAIQKLTASALAKKNPSLAKATVKTAVIILSVAGIIGSFILWNYAEFFAFAMKEKRAVWAIKAIAPSVFLVAVSSAVKSGFEGGSDMIPTAVSQVIEAIIKLAAGYMLAVLFMGLGTEKSAAGAVAGVSIGEAAATFLLVLWYVIKTRGTKKYDCRKKDIAHNLMELALPLMCMSVITSAIAVCDTSVLRASLMRSGMSEEQARFTYGSYSGYVQTVVNLPSGFLATLCTSVIPIVSGAVAVGDIKRIKSVSFRSIGVCGIFSLASVIFLLLFGRSVLNILFHNTAGAAMLKAAAPSVMFISLMHITGAILQSLGFISNAFAASVSAAVIKLICSFLLASKPELNIYGEIIGTNLAFFTGMIINMVSLAVHLRNYDTVICRSNF